jgi:hypothetical protein
VRAVGILRALPDLALVDMRVHIDQARQHDAAVEVELRQAVVCGCRRVDGGDMVVLDDDVAGCKTIRVSRQLPRLGDETNRHARIREPKASERWGDVEEVRGHSALLLRDGRACPVHPAWAGW